MHFQFSQYAIGTAVLLLLLIAGLAALVYKARPAEDKRTRANLSKRISIAGVAFLVIVTAMNALTSLISSAPDPQAWPNTLDAAGAFGLQSDHAYPLELGSRLGGTELTITGSGARFTATSTVTFKPGSVLSVSFNASNGATYILEIPVSKIAFYQKAAAQPTMMLHLNKEQFYGATVTRTYGRCQWALHNFFVTCHRPIRSQTTELSASAQRDGLPATVEGQSDDHVDLLDNATLVVTPEMYQKILGG